MRTVASNSSSRPSFSILTVTVRGVVPSLSSVIPEIEIVSSPVEPHVSAVLPPGN